MSTAERAGGRTVSEAASHNPEHLASVIDIGSKHPDVDKIDFSEATPALLAGVFLAQMRHPSSAELQGGELSERITRLLAPGDRPNPAKFGGRIAQLEEKLNVIFDEDRYDRKLENDLVFNRLIDLMQHCGSKGNDKRFRSEYNAARDMTKLRGLVEDATLGDGEWMDVIARISARVHR